MELELAIGADAAALIARLKPLVATREGRPRNQAIKRVWHDSPDHALLASGQTLALQRDTWRLERLTPGAETWLPAQPAPVVAENQDRTALHDLPTTLAPLAAFDGRRAISIHKLGNAPAVTITLDSGLLRAVTAERPAARITISGEAAAVREAALLIAADIPVSVPLATLAAEGIALATGTEPSPRHAGAPVLPDNLVTIPDALAHILGHLTDVVLANIAQVNQGPEPVHQMRVAVRRARSALSVFRPAIAPGLLDPVRDAFKSLAAKLGPTRDWDVFADETVPIIQQALPGDERIERMVAAVTRRRHDCQKALAAYLAGPEFRLLSIELAWLTAAGVWNPQPGPVIAPAESESPPDSPASALAPNPSLADLPTLHAFADGVLQHRWKKLVSTGKRMHELDIPALHRVRLRAKQARYAAEMFSTLHHGKAASRFIRRLSVLQQRLGVLNDGAVATHLLAELGGPAGRHAYATGVFTGFMAARAENIRPRIIEAFNRFRRLPAYWA